MNSSRGNAISLLQVLGIERDRLIQVTELLKDYSDACILLANVASTRKIAGHWGKSLADDVAKVCDELARMYAMKPAPMPQSTREPWEVARDEVLLKCPHCYQTEYRNDPQWNPDGIVYVIRESWGTMAIGDSSEQAWIAARDKVVAGEWGPLKPTRIQSPAPVWSREIPKENGWYWWRRPDRSIIPIRVESDQVSFCGFTHTKLSYLDTYGFKGAGYEFGPRIPEPPA